MPPESNASVKEEKVSLKFNTKNLVNASKWQQPLQCHQYMCINTFSVAFFRANHSLSKYFLQVPSRRLATFCAKNCLKSATNGTLFGRRVLPSRRPLSL
uniref:Uncharacterized protein n=1 Tax=Globodera pallida TaxID=36090 RepID=A0A183CP50_GLOPA